MKLKERIKKPMFWVTVSFIITIILGIITKITGSIEIYTATVISCIPWVLAIIIAIVFGFIINPIKWLIKKIKDKKT